MKKKGFTLIELMIVLAIIAILAVVLIPKSGIFKKNANTAGVTTNMNTVRAYLETKTGDNYPDTAAKLQTTMSANFNSNEAIANPRDKSAKNVTITTSTTSTSVLIVTAAPSSTNSADEYKGLVIVYYGKVDSSTGPVTTGGVDGYVVYGTDLDGNLMGSKYVIQK